MRPWFVRSRSRVVPGPEPPLEERQLLLGLPLGGALRYEFLELTDTGGSVPGAVLMASVLGRTVMLLVSLTACTVPTLRALRIAPPDALRQEG